MLVACLTVGPGACQKEQPTAPQAVALPDDEAPRPVAAQPAETAAPSAPGEPRAPTPGPRAAATGTTATTRFALVEGADQVSVARSGERAIDQSERVLLHVDRPLADVLGHYERELRARGFDVKAGGAAKDSGTLRGRASDGSEAVVVAVPSTYGGGLQVTVSVIQPGPDHKKLTEPPEYDKPARRGR